MYSEQKRPVQPKFNLEEREDGLIVLTPKSGKINQTVVFLHGWGQSGREWVDYFIEGEPTPEDTKIVLPTAPKRFTTFYNKEGNAWCDFYTLKFSQEDTNAMENYEHVLESVARISKILDKEVEEIGDSQRCFMAGFSSGGFLAAVTWKMFRKPLAGLIIHSGKAGKTIPVAPEQEFSPIFWTHGVDDVLFKYRHGVFNNTNLNTGKRKFVHFTRGGLGHAVDRVIQLKARRFIEDVMIKPKL